MRFSFLPAFVELRNLPPDRQARMLARLVASGKLEAVVRQAVDPSKLWCGHPYEACKNDEYGVAVCVICSMEGP
jgi:hypothetical protein